MRVDYRRDPDSNHLVLWEEQQPEISSYQVRMLMANELKGFLECRVHQMDGELLFYYDITSRQDLAILFQHQSIRGPMLTLLLNSLVEALETLREYLLNMDDLVLDPRFIYTDADRGTIWFCYLPGHRIPFGRQLREFSEFLLPKLDNGDREGVVLGYAFYQLAVKEDFTADDIRALIHGTREGGDPRREPSGEPEELPPRQSGQREEKIPETREELLEAFFMPETAEEKISWKKALVPGVTGAAAVLLAAGAAWMGKPLAGAGAGAALTAAVLIPYYFRLWKKEKKEEESRMERYSAGDFSVREETYQDSGFPEEPESGEQTLYLGPEGNSCGGCLIPVAAGETLRLDRQVILLGKSRQYADLQLPSPSVSRLHARMVWNGETYELGDLNSRNGTWINDQLLGSEQPRALHDGDRIRFADLTYLYRK